MPSPVKSKRSTAMPRCARVSAMRLAAIVLPAGEAMGEQRSGDRLPVGELPDPKRTATVAPTMLVSCRVRPPERPPSVMNGGHVRRCW
jgi:hypothetical protein